MELEFVDWLKPQLPPHPLLKLGVGDDAAILDLGLRQDCVVTTDLLTEGVDFLLAECGGERVGRKALAVNLSDLAAMAARPVGVVVALALPSQGAAELARQIITGMLPLAEHFKVAIAGGDTNCWPGGLVVSLTAIGAVEANNAWTRHGAQPGDALLVTGSLGGSILGRHFDFQPRVEEALQLQHEFEVHAAIDISDGLSLDVARLAAASGCGVELEAAAIPIAPDAQRLSKSTNKSPLAHALSDGEDFELLLAMPEAVARRLLAEQPLDIPLTRIGEMTLKKKLWLRQPGGERIALEPRGFEHGKDS